MAKDGSEARASKASGGEATASKRKRKRKTRLPKDFDPEHPGPPPDPERWLPKWQRSDYKRKRRNRKVHLQASWQLQFERHAAEISLIHNVSANYKQLLYLIKT